MSDGVGENYSCYNKYCHIEDFIQVDDEYSAVVFNDKYLWQDASDIEVLDRLGSLFIDVSRMVRRYGHFSELYWNDESKHKKHDYGRKTVHEIIEALLGYKRYFDVVGLD